jgi:hypothetical protein
MVPRAALAVLALGLLLAGCGGGGADVTITGSVGRAADVPGDANPADVKVIDDWVEALDRGDINAAAGYFAIPSVTENGVLLRIRSLADAKLFNAGLPCGAHVIKAVSVGKFTTATFRLSERRGPGAGCGPGTGGKAQTSFVIRDGKIAEWRRVGAAGPAQGAPAQST